MPFASNVPKIQFTQAGLVLPDEQEILDGVASDIDYCFGGGLNPSLETPQGQLASSTSAVISDKNSEISLIVNQIDPQYSDGKFQDAIGRIYMMTRKPGLPTVVQATIIGIPGSVVPAGTLAKDTSDNTYSCVNDSVISQTGQSIAQFQCVANGPIPCPAGTLTKVYQAVTGWDSITNDDPGTVGALVESRQDFEFRRKNSVEINANGTVGSVYSSVFNTKNVIDVYVYDNYSGDTVLVGATDYPVAKNSIYVAAVGGADIDVAKSIWMKKSLGCDMTGNTTVTVSDESGYNYPYPTYSIKFNRPASLTIKFEVRIVNDPSLPFNIIELIKDAIIGRFNGSDGGTRERIAASIFSSRYYAAISAVSDKLSIISVLIGTSTATLTSIEVGIDQHPVTGANEIEVILV